MALFILRRVVVIAALLFPNAVLNPVKAQDSGTNRFEAARAFAGDRDGLLAPVQLFGLTADLFCRSYFVELRRDADWGPNHPRWARLLPEFCSEILVISIPAGQSVEDFLASELASGLTGPELAMLDMRNSDPAVAAAASRLQMRGLNWMFFVQAQRPPGTDGLYSIAERDAARKTVQILRRELPSVEPDLRALGPYVGAAEFKKYQRVLEQAFMKSAGRIDPSPKGNFAALMGRWQAKVSEATR